jgi:hypothetical protein
MSSEGSMTNNDLSHTGLKVFVREGRGAENAGSLPSRTGILAACR